MAKKTVISTMNKADDNPDKNFNLTRDEFEHLRKQLQQGDETLIETIYLNHVPRCIKYLMNQFGNSSAVFEKVRESVFNALAEIRLDLLAGKLEYGNLNFYFTGRALRKHRKSLKKDRNIPIVGIVNQDFESDQNIEKELSVHEMNTLVGKAIAKLCKDCKNILILHYYEEHSFKEIAKLLEKSHTSILQKAVQCRKKLRYFLGESFNRHFS